MDVFKKLARDSRLNIRDVFMAFDSNGDGIITADEFHSAMARLNLGLTPCEIAHILAQLDVNRDGKITYKELLGIIEQPRSIPAATKSTESIPKPQPQADPLKEVVQAIASSGIDLAGAFRVFDQNGDGLISREEFGKVFSDMKLGFSAEQVRGLQDRVDKNRDGKISFAEFKALFESYGIVFSEARLGTSSSSQSMNTRRRQMRSVSEIYRLLADHMTSTGLSIQKFYKQSITTPASEHDLTRSVNSVISPALSKGEISALMTELCGPGQSRFTLSRFAQSFQSFFNQQSGTSLDVSRRQKLLEATESMSSSLKQSYEETKTLQGRKK